VTRKRSDTEVFRISGARAGLTADIRGRQRRYVISMAIRTVCVLLAVVLWHVQTVVAAIALVLGCVLPYVAVVIANAGRTDAPSAPPAFVPAPTRHMLEPGAPRGPGHDVDRADESYPEA
jgi:Flp pilus assembly protein TadB